MNLNANPTIQQLRELITTCDDWRANHQLWVNKSGDVRLACIPKNEKPHLTDAQIIYDTFLAGHDYVGPDAAADPAWLNELYDSLMTEWSRSKGSEKVASVRMW